MLHNPCASMVNHDQSMLIQYQWPQQMQHPPESPVSMSQLRTSAVAAARVARAARAGNAATGRETSVEAT